jgi:formamidopyrimidine-DNA glycosylase
MPELPEVETMRRGIASIAGSRIVRAERPVSRYRPAPCEPSWDEALAGLAGRTIVDVGRVGKRIILAFDDGGRFVFEPRMTGLALLAEPPTEEHLRLVLHLAGGAAEKAAFWDRRGIGTFSWFASEADLVASRHGRIGPDALAIEVDDFRRIFAKSDREIKVALLDQALVAGIGNLYASEILHEAKIHPARRCPTLKLAEWKRVADATRRILEQAIRYEGSTLGDGTYRNALNQDGSYQNCHRVYAKAGERCVTCTRGVVTRVVQAQRSTFFCAVCQRAPRSRSARLQT